MRRSPARPLALALLSALGLALAFSGCGGLKRAAYSGPGRDDWQQPARVVEALELEPGEHVADLGAGGGYFTFRLAEAVGPDGRVYAVDVDAGMLEHIDEEARERGLENVVPLLAAPDDPRLPDGGIDLVFSANTYHHLDERAAYFRRVRESDLRPRGRVAIVELKEAPWLLGGHVTQAEVIREEMEAAGYALERTPAFLERQHFLIFRPAASATEPAAAEPLEGASEPEGG